MKNMARKKRLGYRVKVFEAVKDLRNSVESLFKAWDPGYFDMGLYDSYNGDEDTFARISTVIPKPLDEWLIDLDSLIWALERKLENERRKCAIVAPIFADGTIFGFYPENTGGGLMVLARYETNGDYIWISSTDGGYLPESSQNQALVGIYVAGRADLGEASALIRGPFLDVLQALVKWEWMAS